MNDNEKTKKTHRPHACRKGFPNIHYSYNKQESRGNICI